MAKAEINENIRKRYERLYGSLSKEELIEKLMNAERGAINEEIRALTKEEFDTLWKENVKASISERMKDADYVDRLFFETSFHDGSIDYRRPKEILSKNLNELIDAKMLREFRQNFAEHLKEHMDEICKSVMLQCFINGLANSSSFSTVIQNAIDEVRYR